MVSDSIVNASIPSTCKDFHKKKRSNRLAKLKQSKLDARREQWLSQVNKGCKETIGGARCQAPAMQLRNESGVSLEKLEMRPKGKEENNDESNHQDSDSESMSNSPTSSLLSSTDSGKNGLGSSSSGSSSSSGGCCSGSITEEEEEEDGCFDDWEAVADALAADDKQQHPILALPVEQEPVPRMEARVELPNSPGSGVGALGRELEAMSPMSPVMAWKPNDALRPQSLPNLMKQHSFPTSSERHFGREPVAWPRKSVISAPSSCPICYEDLDVTDSSFLPCLCGFRLCLFCHKRIIEEDARCPGCRKKYESDPNAVEPGFNGASQWLARSFSMVTRRS